jgi:hypothetical protein
MQNDPEALKPRLDAKEQTEQKKENGPEDLQKKVEEEVQKRMDTAEDGQKKMKKELNDTEEKKKVLQKEAGVKGSVSIESPDLEATKKAKQNNEKADDLANLMKDVGTGGLGPDGKTIIEQRTKIQEVPTVTTHVKATEQAQSSKQEKAREDSVEEETAEGRQKKAN